MCAASQNVAWSARQHLVLFWFEQCAWLAIAKKDWGLLAQTADPSRSPTIVSNGWDLDQGQALLDIGFGLSMVFQTQPFCCDLHSHCRDEHRVGGGRVGSVNLPCWSVPRIPQIHIPQRWSNDSFFMFIVNNNEKTKNNEKKSWNAETWQLSVGTSRTHPYLSLLCIILTAGHLMCYLQMHFEFKPLLSGPFGGEAIHEAPGAKWAEAASVSKCCWK